MSPSRDPPEGESPSSGTSTPRIAIKGFSFAAKSGGTATYATKAKPVLGKRPRSALHHGDSDEDSDSGRHEVVTGFGAGGAIKREEDRRENEGPLVIARLKDTDWKTELRKKQGKNLLPPEVQAQRAATSKEQEGVDVFNGEADAPKWGLSVTRPEKPEKAEIGDTEVKENKEGNEMSARKSVNDTGMTQAAEKPREKTDDQLALEALMGIRSERKGPDLVISAVESNTDSQDLDWYGPVTEEDAYRRAVRSAPDVSTLEDYERVPVEEFGAALLRGMGWKEGDAKKGRVERPKEVKRRQNLLGLGATELKDAEELGAWVQKSDTKRLMTSSGRGDRPPKASEYRREKERREERRDERSGGSYRRDRERERDEYRDRNHHRDRDRRR